MSPNWQPRGRREQEYYRTVLQIIDRVLRGDPVSLIAAEEFLRKYAWQAAQRMVVGLLYDGARTWRAAARESMQGARIYAALQHEMSGPVGQRVRELIRENALLIRSLPLKIAEQVNAKVAEKHYEGVRAEAYSDQLMAHLAGWHVRLIARTETSKASTALTQARAEELNLSWWVWQTSRDERVRPAHRKMQGIICSWNELPAPELLVGMKSEGHYAAGNIYNCRCYPEPLLYLDQVSWPHKVHRNGQVLSTTRAAFARVARIPISAKEAA